MYLSEDLSVKHGGLQKDAMRTSSLATSLAQERKRVIPGDLNQSRDFRISVSPGCY